MYTKKEITQNKQKKNTISTWHRHFTSKHQTICNYYYLNSGLLTFLHQYVDKKKKLNVNNGNKKRRRKIDKNEILGGFSSIHYINGDMVI